MGVYEELQARGLLAQLTDAEKIREMINNGRATFYIGFDPTADSLHVGHFMALCLMKRLQMAGNKPIALLGGGTGMVGDPSGRTDSRPMMTVEEIQHNCECFRQQMSRFIDLDLNYVNLLREVGTCFTVNEMLAARCYKQRWEKGLTFFEFNYMIMQAYDFYMLYKNYGCQMQFGGDDQWSNMLAGRELIRRKLENADSEAMTITLLTNSEGKKMGKTAKGAVWLDPNKTSPFDFYQYWRNVGDQDVIKCMKLLTFLPIEEIESYEKKEGQELNAVKEVLAYNLTEMVHGEEEAKKAQDGARRLFAAGGADTEHLEAVMLDLASFRDGKVDLIGALVAAALVTNRSEGRRAIEQGGVLVDEEKVTDVHAVLDQEKLKNGGIVLRRGKKKFAKVAL